MEEFLKLEEVLLYARENICCKKYRSFCNTYCLEVSSKIRKEFKGIVLE